MARQIINVGAVPNDGTGDPIRTAYIKCNDNFGELYSRAQSSPPPTLVGSPGDTEGMYAYDQNNFYYCYANYDGSSDIWGQVADTGSPTQLVNGTSNVSVAANSNITISSAGTSNVAVFTDVGASIAGNLFLTRNFVLSGNIGASGNVTANYFIGNGSQLTGLPEIYGNANVAAYLPTYTGNISSGNITTSGILTVTGNITGGNVTTAGRVTATGNVTGGNIITSGQLAATGNVSGSYIIGDGSLLTNVTAASNVAVTEIANTTSKISINGPGGSALIQVAGVANVAVFTASGEYIGGLLDVTGNIDAGNLRTVGTVLSTGNITGGNIITAGKVTATGNVTSGNLITTGYANVTGNVNATGNITGSYLFGNGALLTGVITSVANINLGTSNVTVNSSGGPVSVNIGGVANVAVFTAAGEYVSGLLDVTGNITGGNVTTAGKVTATGNITSAGNIAGGNLSGTSIAGTLTTAAQTNITSVGTLGSLDVTGNITSGNLQGTSIVGTLTTSSQTNITSVGTLGSLTVTGNISGGNLSVSTGTVTLGNIVNANANGVGNIGSSTTYFDTVFAKATSAEYADVAEYYESDADYPPGTVVKFGTATEITIANVDHDAFVVGVISENPAFVMNSGLEKPHALPVALVGRTPCLVLGPVRRGQMMVSAGNGRARAETTPAMGTVIGKALENFDGVEGTIEILVGRT